MSQITFNYENLKCSVEELRKCVEYFLPHANELDDTGYRGRIPNKQLLKRLLENNPSSYEPSLLEFFFWKDVGNVDEIIEQAKCYCGKIGLFDKCHMIYGACCKEHSKDNRIYRSEQATLKKYGVKYNLQNKDTHKKTLEKWDGKSPFSNKEIRQRAKNTIKEKYGVENAMQVEEFCQKSRNTRLKVYGTERANPEKAKATMQERYGVDYFSQSNKFKKLWPKSGGDPEFNNKVREKEYNTKKENNSFNTSKPEERILSLLIDKFGKEDVVSQYKEDRYPYKSDFYIKSLDLFIEYQGTWTHGGHPFNKRSVKDKKKLKVLKERSACLNFKGEEKNYYDIAIYVWTKLDPAKRKTAKKNNLNWLEFFSEQDVINWLEEIKNGCK